MTTPGEFMRSEIAEQPAMLARLATAPVDQEVLAAVARLEPPHLQLVARGTSGHAGLHAKYLAEAVLGLPVVIVAPSVITRLGGSPWSPRDLVIAVSQSGASPDLIACVRSARAAQATTVSYVNAEGSELADEADIAIGLGAGPELAVAATKSYTASLLALTRLVAALAPEDPGWEWDGIGPAVQTLLDDRAWLDDAIPALESATSAVVIGRSYSYATAREAALKIMETCALPCLAYSSAEFWHGPLAAVGPGTVVFFTGEVDAGLVAACRSAGGRVVIAPRSGLRAELSPIADIVPFQMLARSASLARGLDPDRPAVLAKATLTL